MKTKSDSKVIGLFGVFGKGNLGCAAAKLAMIANIKKRFPDAIIYGFSANPINTQKTHRIQCFPINRNAEVQSAKKDSKSVLEDNSFRASQHKKSFKILLKQHKFLFNLAKLPYLIFLLVKESFHEMLFLYKSYQQLKSVDLFIVAGGGQLGDIWGSQLFGHSFTILKWAVLSKLCKTRFIFFNVGANFIKYRFNRFLTSLSLRLASYISFRDRSSKLMLRDLRASREGIVSVDPAYSLELPHSLELQSKCDKDIGYLNTGNLVVGINPIAYCDPRSWYKKDKNAYENYLLNMTSVVQWLIIEGYRVVFTPSQIKMDINVVKDIKTNIVAEMGKAHLKKIEAPEIENIYDLVNVLSKIDVAVACRYHGVIIPHLLGKPVLAITYHPKSVDLITAISGPEYFIDIDEFDLNIFKKKFLLMIENRDKISRKINENVLSYRKNLDLQFDYILKNLME